MESEYAAQEMAVYMEILDSLIMDVASESHRAARLGLDSRLNMDEEEEQRLSLEAKSMVGETETPGGGNKFVVDVFGQTHPVVASQVLECMNCSRPVVAGRFAPHLEKCMGKGRKARSAANRSILAGQQRRPRAGNNRSGNDSTPSD